MTILDIKNQAGFTPLELAVSKEQTACCEALRAATVEMYQTPAPPSYDAENRPTETGSNAERHVVIEPTTTCGGGDAVIDGGSSGVGGVAVTATSARKTRQQLRRSTNNIAELVEKQFRCF